MKGDEFSIYDILFFDVETASLHEKFSDLDDEEKELWQHKAEQLNKGEDFDLEASYDQAAIYAEFGRIVCISVGIIRTTEDGKRAIHLNSYCDFDEKKLLTDFAKMLNEFIPKGHHTLCGHNILEFDVPYVARRMLINGVELPKVLDVGGLKPWQVNFIDTLELWKFGDRKSPAQLKLLTHVFGIPTPKDDIDGSEVGRVFHQEKDLERISTYCKKDVVATAQVFLKMRREAPIDIEIHPQK